MSCSPPAPAPAAPKCEPITSACSPVSNTTSGGTCPPISFCSGNYTYTYAAGCLKREPRAGAIPDGWYSRVRVQDGCIVEATDGPAPVTQLPSPCIAGGGGGGGGTGSGLTPDACNLARMNGDQLSVLFNSQDTEYITVDGCGTTGSPFRATLDFALMKQDLLGGVNLNSCGIDIRDGVVHAMPLPVINISVDSSASEVFSVVRTGCDVVLKPLVRTGGQVYTRMFCCESTSTTGVTTTTLGGVGGVFAGTGGTAAVEICPVAGVTAPTIPNSFATVQEAINWLDQQVLTCPAADNGGVGAP